MEIRRRLGGRIRRPNAHPGDVMLPLLLAAAALAGSNFEKRPLPEAVVLGRAGWETLPGGLEELAPGDALVPIGGGLEIVASDCLEGEPSTDPAPPELVEALSAGVIRPPPAGRSWAEGPVPQTVWGAAKRFLVVMGGLFWRVARTEPTWNDRSGTQNATARGRHGV